MDIISQRNAQIACLQKNLSAVRKIAGWTSEQLGEKIGVTKQTISNLENEKTKMTLTQYIAIRSIIDYEIQTNKENSVLPQVVEVLLNHYDEYSEEERKKVTENVKTIAATASGGVRGENLVKVSTVLLSGFFAVLPVVVKATEAAGKAIWLSKILKEKDKKLYIRKKVSGYKILITCTNARILNMKKQYFLSVKLSTFL